MQQLSIQSMLETKSWKFSIHTVGTKFNREEQEVMRQTFRKTLDFVKGPVQMKHPDVEFLLIREIELDGKGSPILLSRYGSKEENGNDEATSITRQEPQFCTDAIAYYFGRVLGGTRQESRGIDRYNLKKRPYLGPTSMDAELSFVMTSLGHVKAGSLVFDPFVGTGSILLACALRGAYTVGTDIDIRVLRGKGGNQTIWKNFEYYKLPRPEIIRSDNSLYCRHFRHHAQDQSFSPPIASPLYDAIICDPPYGIRAGARKTGSKLDQPRPVLEENRHDHIAQTKSYPVSDVMSDLLDMAARTLVIGGRLVYIIPSFQNFDPETDLPRHDCLELIHSCYQPFTSELGRRIVAMKKVMDYDESSQELYRQSIWIHGTASAEKCANLRDKILEAAKQKPGYEKRAAIRKEKRKANKEAKKEEKRPKTQQQSGVDEDAKIKLRSFKS
jgi:tRNA (guanine10-N2)-methyltransferase